MVYIDKSHTVLKNRYLNNLSLIFIVGGVDTIRSIRHYTWHTTYIA